MDNNKDKDTRTKNRKDIVPYQKPLPPEKNPSTDVDPNAAWITEDGGWTTLEELLDIVEANFENAPDIEDLLRNKALPRGKVKSDVGKSSYSESNLDYLQRTTSHKYIGIRNFRTQIHDAVFLITRDKDTYPGKVIRMVGIVETVMLHYGLHELDEILANRSKVIRETIQAIKAGEKEKRRRGTPPHYTWVVLIEEIKNQHNVTCLEQRDYARLKTLSDDYGWSMAFIAEIAMVCAIASSTRLPRTMVNSVQEEVRYFREYLEKYFS